MSLTVALDADGGAGAESPAFFRSSRFLRVEGVTHTLRIEDDGGRCAIPLVVRPVGDLGLRDAVSPYGYPGGSVEGRPPRVSGADLGGLGLVSIFLRERLGGPSLAGAEPNGTVLLHDPTRPRSLGKSFRRSVRRNEEAGYRTDLVAGEDATGEMVTGFAEVYRQTMGHVAAAERYAFSLEYLTACVRSGHSWLAVVREPDGRIVAGELMVESDGHLHSYLAGTCSAHRSTSPGKNATLRLLDAADELGLPLNHGGGMTPGDGIEVSKRSYCNAAAEYFVHRLVCDEERYRQLPDPAPGSGFFPRYRAPVSS